MRQLLAVFFLSHLELRFVPQKLLGYPTSQLSTQLGCGVRNALPLLKRRKKKR
jgi:hypothetical protein